MKSNLLSRRKDPPCQGLTALYAILMTQALSMIGSRMSTIGLGLWLFTQTGTTTPLLLAAFFLEVPGMVLGSVAGAVIDRVPRKPVLILTDAGLALGTLVYMFSIGLFLASMVGAPDQPGFPFIWPVAVVFFTAVVMATRGDIHLALWEWTLGTLLALMPLLFWSWISEKT